MQDASVLSPPMERATCSPQSRHRKRRLLEATQHVSPPSDRLLIENTAAQVAVTQNSDQTEAVNACIRVLRNVKNSVYLRALAARALGLLMLQNRALADRLRLETEGLVDALLQVVGYCRRSRTHTTDTRRVHVNCCLVISLLMQAPSQQHLQLVVSLDSDLLVLQPLPSERESANLLLTVAGRPESGDITRPTGDDDRGVVFGAGSIEILNRKKKIKKKRRQAASSPPRAAGSKNQQSPPRQQRRKIPWTEHNVSAPSDHEVMVPRSPGSGYPRSNNGWSINRVTGDNLAANIASRNTPSRFLKMERHRLVTPIFPRQCIQDIPLNPLPLIQPTGGHHMSGDEVISEQTDQADETQATMLENVFQPHPASDTLLHPKHMLEIFRTGRMPLASTAYFQQHLRDGDIGDKEGKPVPSRLQITQWDQWKKSHHDEDDSARDAMTAVSAMPREHHQPDNIIINGDRTVNASPTRPGAKRQVKVQAEELGPATPAFKRQRLREILTSPVDPNEHNVRQLRTLAQRVNTSVMTSLESDIERARHEENRTRQEMHSMIQQERERLPLKFLFQLPGGAAYCRHRMRRAMALWILEFEDNQRRMALMQWKAFVEHARFLERGEEYHRQATKRRLKVAIEYVLRGYQQQGLRKWTEATQLLIWHDRDTAARRIQAAIRRHQGRERFVALHRRHPFASPVLRDIYLAPARPDLPFRIPSEVREHRRKLWQAADLVQCAYRYRRFRIALTRYRVAAIRIQALQRMRAARSRYRHVRRQIILVQARVRMRFYRDAFLVLRNAVLLVQAVFRSVRMRRLRRLVLCAQRKESERVLSSAVLLQRVARGFLGRIGTRQLRLVRDQEWHAALIFQRCWYKRNNEWSTFLLLGCLREKENEERMFDAQVLAYKRNHMARVIRRTWLAYLASKRSTAAGLIQRNVRRRLAHHFVEFLRRQKMAHRRIKWFFRVHHSHRIRTARYLQFWWLKTVPGRLRHHLFIRRTVEALEDRRRKYEREENSSSRMQALVRGHMGRKVALRMRSARSIQRAIRVHLMRKHFREEMARIRALVSLQTADKCIDTAMNKVVEATMKLYNASACAIQRIFRGCHCRMRVMRDIVYSELRARMAVRIQRKWRQNTHQRAARKLLQAQKRKQTNPFRTETSVSAIIDKMLSSSAVFYDPNDELRGMMVQEWLHRLGLGAKYGELFQKNRWVSSIDSIDILTRLRELNIDACGEKLESIGVHDNEDMQMMLTNLFAYQTIQETKRQRRELALAREKQVLLKRNCDRAQRQLQACINAQQKYENALEEVLQEAKEFRNPPKAVRDRQAACTRELEDAVKKTTQVHGNCESSAALHAAHAREISTLQQQFASQQEPKEISAVHSQRSLRFIDQLNVAREIFLERFPGLDARAFAFVSALEESQVTRWQLQRFFDTYTTVSEVKQNMKELTFFSFETEVKKHNHARFGQCADILQYGLERLAELFGISMEMMVLGAENATVSGGGQHNMLERSILERTLLGTISASTSARGNQEKARIWQVGAAIIAKMNAKATKIQSLWRRRAGNKLVAELRVNQRHKQVREQYVAEFHTDHVTPFWQSERKKEQEALDAWLAEEAKAHRIRRLYNITRYPYVEEWDDEAQAYVYAIYSQVDSAALLGEDLQPFEQTQTRYYVTEKPTYSIEEEDIIIRIQAQTRRFLAQRHLHELQRSYRRERRRAALEVEWNNAKQERAQLLTLTFQFQFRNNAHVKTWLNTRLKSKPPGPRKPSAMSPTRKPSAVSPTKYGNSITKGIDPSTAGKAKSPTKAAGREQKEDITKVDKEQEQSHLGVHGTLNAAVDALAPTYHVSVRAEHRRNLSFPANSRPGNAHSRAIIRLLEELPTFYRQTAPELQVASRLRYTKMALRFGWEEVQSNTAPVVNTINASRSYYFNKSTLETSWERPDYSFDEQIAAIQIQALARMILAINARERELASISFVATVQDAIKQAARLGWVGYSLEGMTAAVFLSRFGLIKYITSALGQSPLEELLATVSSEEKAKSLGWSKEEVGLVPLFPQILPRRFPRSCSRATSVPASIKHPFNILPSERVISQLVTQSYPNQHGRVTGLLRALRNSTTPISYRQLEMHLRRYAGRPDDAIANVGEITSLAIATREPQEKTIFAFYLRCAERCVVYAANLKLTTLQRELSAVLRMPRHLMPSPAPPQSPAKDETMRTKASIPVVPVSPEEEERWLQQALSRYPSRAVKGLWENEMGSSFSHAQMALYLREEALERVLAWERTALLCQTAFRMLRVRRWYLATQEARARAATMIQCAWRALGAREVRALLESQQQSPYEQRLDKRTNTFYFVYTPTDEKLLEEPRDEVTGGILPFRPMIQDRITKSWMLAWPHYTPASQRARTSKTAPGADTPWVACSLCTAERAARRCNECYSPTGDYVDFCLACFYDRHFPTAANGPEDLSWHTYTALNPLSTPFFRCVECSRPSVIRCLPCNEHYCERCFTRVHSRGKTRSRHAREWYAAHAAACVECEMRVACQRCLTCQDALCETCMARTHARGRRADGKAHTMELLPQLLEPGDVYCEQCRARRGDERCEFCAQTLCAVCHWSSSSPTGVRNSRHALVCVETALAEKRRELLGDRGLCTECGKAADRECVTCGDRYCSVRWMGNPGCFERFHVKGKRSDHTFTMVEVPTEMPQEILALEEQVRVKRRRDAETAEHEAKRLAAALLEEEGASAKKKATKTRQKKTKKKKHLSVGAPNGKKICAVPQCRHRALVLDIPGASFCPEHFTLQHALEVAERDPLEAARLLTLVDNGGGRVVKKQKTGWRGLLPGNFFSRGQRDTKKPRKLKETSTSVQVESSTTTTT
ncbi:hypothetical protein L917_00806 [Phytophthora nicotianae]|uniref:WW domain-containing protein n=4 Tax=Phytophthora nicotianae TaxID=4792 RepID=W2P815_PHYNI|nr:hypothetical protein L917_00806 [Phytophthora nicotianae]ETM56109.1 hypothetical protein L914_00836 [Phytophthora nicotianae]ETO85425.1 hypothetical protein F444_00914 [Phytophthora nicotianae P1976]